MKKNRLISCGTMLILAAALILPAPIAEDTYGAETYQSSAIPYAPDLKVSTEPAYPYAWDDEEHLTEVFFKDHLPGLKNQGSNKQGLSFSYATTALLGVGMMRRASVSKSAASSYGETELLTAVFGVGYESVSDQLQGTVSQAAQALQKWKPVGFPRLLDAYEYDYGAADGKGRTKYWIRNYGGVAAVIEDFDPSEGNRGRYSAEHFSYASEASAGAGYLPEQTVVLVGYDDDYPKENFVSAPSENGAWLVRNSMGTTEEFGLGTYFWLSYEDPGLEDRVMAFAPDCSDGGQSTGHATRNTYQTTDASENRMRPESGCRAANVFTASGPELLEAVSFFYDPEAFPVGEERDTGTGDSTAASAEITIRGTVGGVPSDNAGDVIITLEKQTLYGGGLYTVPVPGECVLESGKQYAVEVKLDKGSVALEAGNTSYTAERRSDGVTEIENTKTYENPLQPAVTIYEGESFFNAGGAWQDVSKTSTGKEQEELFWDGNEWVDAADYFAANPDKPKNGTYLVNGFTYGNFHIHALTSGGNGGLRDLSAGSMYLKNPGEVCYFTGLPLCPEMEVRFGNSTLVKNRDYRLVYGENLDAGEAFAYAVGMGSYLGTLRTPFTIKAVDLSGEGGAAPAKVTLNPEDAGSCTYDQKPQKPGVKEVTISLNGREETVSSAYVLAEYENNINAGTETAKAHVSAKPSTRNYINSSADTAFSIAPLELNDTNTLVLLTESQFPYTGNPIEPSFTVTVQIDGVETVLENGRDYDYTYNNNTEIGNNAFLTITGKGNYTGTVLKYFAIVYGGITIENVTLNPSSFSYNRKVQRPEVIVTVGGRTLRQGSEYVVEWPDMDYINVGTKNVRVISVPSGNGVVDLTYEIKQRDLSLTPKGEIVVIPGSPLDRNDFRYTGEAIEPSEFTVLWDGKTLVEGEDYTVSWQNNTNIGNTAKVIVQGIGNFTGTLSQSFSIFPAELSEFIVSVDPVGYIEDGYPVDPDLRKDGSGIIVKSPEGKVLTRGTDYVVELSDNLRPGEATVTITGRGNYTGTGTAHFQVLPKNGGTSSGNEDPEGGSDSGIGPDPGEKPEDAGFSQVFVAGLTLNVTDSNLTFVGGEKQKVTTSFSGRYKKYVVVEGKKNATVSRKGVLKAQKAGYTVVVGFERKKKKWVPAEAVQFRVDIPSFAAKTVYARKTGEPMNMAFFLDSIKVPSKWTVSDKATAKIVKKTGELIFKKAGEVKVTAWFGKKAAYSVNAVLKGERNPERNTAISVSGEGTSDTETDGMEEEAAPALSAQGHKLVPTGYSYLDPKYNDPYYIQVVVLAGDPRYPDAHKYCGKSIRPDVAVRLINTPDYRDERALQEGIEYEIFSYENDVDACTVVDYDKNGDPIFSKSNPPKVTVKVWFNDGSVGLFSQYYEIQPFLMTDVVVSPKKFVVAMDNEIQKPVPMVTATMYMYDSHGTYVKTTRNLSEGIDFEVEYVDKGHTVSWPNVIRNKGIYSIHLKGINNYGDVNKECQVQIVDPTYGAEDLSRAQIIFTNKTGVYTYDPLYGVIPDIEVKLGGKTLTEDKDYYLQYSRYTAAGTAQLTISAVGGSRYTGISSAIYTVKPLNLKNCRIRGIEKQTWRENVNGVICPDLYVTYGAQALAEGSDYTVQYVNNAKVGKATVTLKAVGPNYVGVVTKNYKITRKKLKLQEADLNVQSIKNDGTVLVYADPFEIDVPLLTTPPDVTSIIDRSTGTTLVRNKDYTLTLRDSLQSYRDPTFKQKNPPTMIIKGIGNYKFKFIIHFLVH
ncbi:MAG: hypothetical protein IJT05_04955 [Lachnospiraceae bacterium]|nr:hypothetical protein [Lachnospiraceae bacterium]